jgi:hypothetical protein
MATDLPPPVNHVFVDFENVQEVSPALIGAKSVHLTLLLGPRNKKLDTEVVEKLLEHAAAVHFIRLTTSGRNALDFALAYYVGRAAVTDPTGSFHIVSKDKGYDPLIEHLQSKRLRAQRHDDFSTLHFGGPAKPPLSAAAHRSPPAPTSTAVKPAAPPSSPSAMAAMLKNLRAYPDDRPKRKATLIRFVKAQLGKQATEEMAVDIVEELRQAGHLDINEKGAVTYHLAH